MLISITRGALSKSIQVFIIAALTMTLSLPVVTGQTQKSPMAGEWSSYGGDNTSAKYSALDQINKDNFSKLKIAWRWKSVDEFLSKQVAGGEWWSKAENIFDTLQEESPTGHASFCSCGD